MKTAEHFLICLGIVLASCTHQQKPSETATLTKNGPETDTLETVPVTNENQKTMAVCIWEGISLRKGPSPDADWITSLSLGEMVTSLGEVKADTTSENRNYLKIRLADGTEGWSVKDFIIPDAKPGVFTVDQYLYKRPDLLTKTAQQFNQLDIVAVKSSEDGWAEVAGKPREKKWIESGWVKKESLSEELADIAVAKFATSALNEKKIRKPH